MSVGSFFKTLGQDIEKGLAIAAPIAGAFVPQVSPILIEIAQIIAALENTTTAVNTGTGATTTTVANTLTPEQMSSIIQAVTTVASIKQATTNKS